MTKANLADGDISTTELVEEVAKMTGRRPSAIRGRLYRALDRGEVTPRPYFLASDGRPPQRVWPQYETKLALQRRERMLDVR